MSTASAIPAAAAVSAAGRRTRTVLLALAAAATMTASAGVLASAAWLAGSETPFGVGLTGIVILALSVLVPTAVLPMGMSAAARVHVVRMTSGPSASRRVAVVGFALVAAGASMSASVLAWTVQAPGSSVWAFAALVLGVVALAAVAPSLLPWPRAEGSAGDTSEPSLTAHRAP